MKHFPFSKNISLTCLTLAVAAALGSCSYTASAPATAARVLSESTVATVFSYNDTSSPKYRECIEAGPLPARAARALSTWLRTSTPKSFSYTYPQYYVALESKTGKTSVWGLCSDGQGNLIGVMVPRAGVPAWDIPYASEHTVYVCDTAQRKELSKAIMDSLADAGYDDYRIGIRRASGLSKRYLISKPLSDEAQKRLEKIRQAEAEAAAAQANRGSGSDMSSMDDDDDFDFGGGSSSSSSSASDDDDSSSDDSGDDDTTDETEAADAADGGDDAGDDE